MKKSRVHFILGWCGTKIITSCPVNMGFNRLNQIEITQKKSEVTCLACLKHLKEIVTQEYDEPQETQV